MGENPVGSPIRLMLVDDHELFRDGLGQLLASEGGFELVATCGTSHEALEILSGAPVDLIVLDLELGKERGTQLIAAARQAGYTGRFLVITAGLDARSLALSLKLGVSGIFLMSESAKRLVQAIRLVATGDMWLDPSIVAVLADLCLQETRVVSNVELTRSERKVLSGILAGLTNKRIGNSMGTSESNVRGIVQRLFRKAGVRRRTQLIQAALGGSFGLSFDLIRLNASRPSAHDPRCSADVASPSRGKWNITSITRLIL